VFLLFSVGTAASAAAGAVAKHHEVRMLEIEIDLFSGRPNPIFALDDVKEAELRNLLSRLGSEPVRSRADAGLGYRGFLIRQTFDNRIAEITVFDGVVEIPDVDGTARSFADNRGVIENWLIDRAIAHIEDSSIKSLLRDIKQRRSY
jgi:hypothetical protein